MIWSIPQVASPEALIPEGISSSLFARTTHGSVTVWSPLEIEVNEFFHVSADDLVGVDVDDLLHIEREKNIEEKNFVAPNNSLFFALSPEPFWPFVSHESDLTSYLLGHCRGGSLERWREEVLKQPKLDLGARSFRYG